MDREAERIAFAKACGYLNYHPWAKWLAHLAGAGTGLVYVALLGVLWLFADLMVSRGVGTIGLPLRFRCRPEVNLLTLETTGAMPLAA